MVQCAVLYPRGGAFNKLRRSQVFLENLLNDVLQDFCMLSSSRLAKVAFVKQRVFDHLKSKGYSFMIFEGDHPERGRLVQPDASEACKVVFQKLRSMKKLLLANPPPKQATRKEKRLENIVHGKY